MSIQGPSEPRPVSGDVDTYQVDESGPAQEPDSSQAATEPAATATATATPDEAASTTIGGDVLAARLQEELAAREGAGGKPEVGEPEPPKIEEKEEKTEDKGLEKTKNALDTGTEVKSWVDDLKAAVGAAWPAVEEFLRENPALKDALGAAGKGADLAEFGANLGKLAIALKKGDKSEAFSAAVEAAASGLKSLPEEAQQKMLEALGKPVAKFLGAWGDRAVGILKNAPLIAKTIGDVSWPPSGAFLDDIRNMGREVGPEVVGTLVQLAARPELGDEGAKVAGNFAQKFVAIGAKALDDLGQKAVEAEKGAERQAEAAARAFGARRAELRAGARELGLNQSDSTSFANIANDAGPNVNDLLLSLRRNGDADGLRAAIAAYKRASQAAPGGTRPYTGTLEQANVPEKDGGIGARTRASWRTQVTDTIVGCQNLLRRSDLNPVERQFYEALIEDQKLLRQVL